MVAWIAKVQNMRSWIAKTGSMNLLDMVAIEEKGGLESFFDLKLKVF
jgi:hypothetical protein